MSETAELVIAAYDMPETDALEEQSAMFGKLKGVRIAVARLSAEKMEKDVLDDFEKRTNAYDIVDVSAAAIPAFAPHLELLDEYVAQNQTKIRVEDWPSQTFDMYARYQEHTIALPWRGSTYLLYYRKDLFQEEGLEPPTDLGKLLTAARKLHSPDKGFYGFVSAQHNGLHICLDWLPVLWSFGGEIYDNTMSTTVNSQEALEAIEYYIDRHQYTAPGVLDFGYYEPLRLMKDGQVAMMQQWSMAAVILEDPEQSKVSGKLGYLPAPDHPIIGGGGLGISKYSARRNMAWEFLEWFTTPEMEKQRVITGGSPTRKSSFSDPDLRARQPCLPAIEQSLIVGRLRPKHQEWNRIQDAIGEAVWLAVSKTTSPADALASANNRVQEILDWDKELALLKTVSALVNQSLNVEEVISSVLGRTMEIEKADAGAIYLLDETTQKPFSAIQRGDLGVCTELGEIDDKLIQRVLQSEEPCLVAFHASRDSASQEASGTNSGIQSLIGFRIEAMKNPIGLAVLGFRRPRRLGYREANLLMVIGQQVGQTIWNAHLYEQVQRHADELEQRVSERTMELNDQVTEAERLGKATRNLLQDLQASNRRLAETSEQLQQANDELELARDKAQEADQLKSAFLAAMSHELRTPLNSIIGFTGIMLQGLAGPLNDEQYKQLGMVLGSAKHLLNLINDVLDISKIEAGQLEIASNTFDMLAAIEKVVATVTPSSKAKALTLVTEIAPEIGQITSDQRRVEQVLLNLLNNAVKFTPEGGSVHVSADMVHDLRPAICVQVADTGIGIQPEDLGRLFQPFQQLDGGIARRHEGTGLGLSICKKLMDMLGGEIRVESEGANRGSVFTVVLPA